MLYSPLFQIQDKSKDALAAARRHLSTILPTYDFSKLERRLYYTLPDAGSHNEHIQGEVL